MSANDVRGEEYEAAVGQILGSDEDTRDALTEAFRQGQADMLAKCIAAVRVAVDEGRMFDECTEAILDVLFALQEKP
jgi:hypothetical protein